MTSRLLAWASRLAGPHALSWPAWLLVWAPSTIWSVAYLTAHAAMPPGWALLWGSVAWLTMGAVWLIASTTWMRWATLDLRRALIIPTFALAALCRSLIIVYVGGPFAGPSPLPLGVLTMTCVSVAATLVIDSYRQLKLQNGRLAAIRDALEQSEGRARVEAASLRSSARQAIAAAIEQALGSESDVDEAAARLRRVSDDVVRPLSHALAAHDEDNRLTLDGAPRSDWVALARTVLDSRPVRPVAVASVIIAMIFGVLFTIYGVPTTLLAASVFWSILVALLWMCRFVPWHRLSLHIGIPALLLAFALAGVVGSLIMRQFPGSKGQVPQGTLLVAIIATLAGSCVALFVGVMRQQRMVEDNLITEGRLLVEVGRTTQAQIRRDRRHLARILHGVVQPRIVARSVRLQALGEPVDVYELARELDDLLGDEATADRSLDVTRSLRDIAEVWAGSAHLALCVDSAMSVLLTPHPSVARAVVEIACEAVNNAVLRGGAQKVDLELVAEGSMLSLRVSNETSMQEADTRSVTPGLGTAIFDDLADQWSFAVSEGTAHFVATLRLPAEVTHEQRLRLRAEPSSV